VPPHEKDARRRRDGEAADDEPTRPWSRADLRIETAPTRAGERLAGRTPWPNDKSRPQTPAARPVRAVGRCYHCLGERCRAKGVAPRAPCPGACAPLSTLRGRVQPAGARASSASPTGSWRRHTRHAGEGDHR
jgi:hypothetical protein